MSASVYGPSAGSDLREVGTLLRRKLGWIVLAVLVCAAIGLIIGLALPKRYRAEGLLVIDTRELNIPEFQSIRSARTVEPWGGRSEARVLTSREIVADVVAKLDLLHDPHFNPTLREPVLVRLLSGIPGLPESWLDPLRRRPDFSSQTEAQIVQGVMNNLAANSEERSYAILVHYTGLDPVMSARLINSLMDHYLDRDVRAKRRAVDQARTQLKQRQDELASDLEATRTKIRALEGQTGSLETNEGTIAAQQAAGVAIERRRLATERAGLESDLSQLEAGLASNQLSVINDRLVSPRLKALWETEANLERSMAEDLARYGSDHPRSNQRRSELDRIKGEIRGEVAAIRNGLRQRIATLRGRDDALQHQLGADEAAAAASAETRTMLAQLKATAASKQTLYDQYRNRYEQTVANSELFSADARVASYADPPLDPVTPSATVSAMIGGLAGLLGSVAVIVGRRWIRDGIETLDEAEQIYGATALGGIPKVTSWIGRPRVSDLVLEQPASALAETVRGILYQIKARQTSDALKVIMITSPLSQDGKSSLVAAMARLGARDGVRCLAVDCDFYRPSLARMIRITPQHYLNEPFANEADLADLVVEDPASGAHFILARPTSRLPGPFALEVMQLRRIIDGARRHYDLIIIDTPPSLAVVDPLVLSQMADAIVLVLPWGTMSRKLAYAARQRLASFACPLLGVVLQRVVGRTHSGYAYHGYGPAKA